MSIESENLSKRYSIQAIIPKLLNMFFPPQCLVCRSLVVSIHSLCADCWGQVTFIARPLCGTCGIPFPAKMDEDICVFCQEAAPAYKAVRSVVRFNDFTAKLIHAMKYYDRTELAPAMARLIVNTNHKTISAADCLAPIPLHSGKLRARKYNQAQLLAKFVARYTGARLIPDLLSRIRDTPSQSGLNRVQRQENVRGAFIVTQKHREWVKNKRIILIDDVITTGVTIDECAKCLKSVGSKDVYGLSFARAY